MNFDNIEPLCKIEIEWIDAAYIIDMGWKTEQEIDDWLAEKIIYKELGYYIKKDKNYIVLCGGYSKKSDGIQQVCGTKVIPIGCVKKITKLK